MYGSNPIEVYISCNLLNRAYGFPKYLIYSKKDDMFDIKGKMKKIWKLRIEFLKFEFLSTLKPRFSNHKGNILQEKKTQRQENLQKAQQQAIVRTYTPFSIPFITLSSYLQVKHFLLCDMNTYFKDVIPYWITQIYMIIDNRTKFYAHCSAPQFFLLAHAIISSS